jgi:hypothetical protein
MDMPTSPLRRVFAVLAVFLSDGEAFAHENYTIEVPLDVAPYATARARAEDSPFANVRVPGLSIFLVVTPCAPQDPEPRPPSAGVRPTSPPEFGCYLVLSTSHVRCATAELLDKWADLPATEQPLSIARTQYGWFIPTRIVPSPPGAGIPVELPPLLDFARAHGCAHILFDCDGPEEPRLPTYPW